MEMTSRLRLLIRFSGDEMRHYGAKEIHLENEWAILEQHNAKHLVQMSFCGVTLAAL